MWRACMRWKGSPLASSKTSVELIRFMPMAAAHAAVVGDAAPHQIRSRSPGEWGSMRSRPAGSGTSAADLLGEPLALEELDEHLGVAPCHLRVGLALHRLEAEVAPAVDYLLGRPTTDAKLQPATGQEVCGPSVLRHVERILVAHVDDRGADLDPRRPSADGGQQRERRAQLASKVVDAVVRTIRTNLLGGNGQLERLEQRVGRERTCDDGDCDQCPKDRNPILFTGTSCPPSWLVSSDRVFAHSRRPPHGRTRTRRGDRWERAHPLAMRMVIGAGRGRAAAGAPSLPRTRTNARVTEGTTTPSR